MSRILVACSLTLLTISPVLAGGSSAATTPCWIWLGKAQPDQVVHFRKTFEVQAPTTAKLYATCDNEMVVFLNGQEIVRSDSWETPTLADVTKELQEGTNVLAVKAKNQDGPAGLLVKLVLETADKKTQVIVTDATWRATEKTPKGWQQLAFNDKSWSPASVVAKLGDAPWTQINKGTLAAAGKQNAIPPTYFDQLKVAKDFKAEMIYAVPKAQGSWVSMTVDPKGRLIASDQHGKLYRITPPPIGGPATATKVEPIPLDIGEAQGLLWAFDALYVVVNQHQGKRPSGLYRVKASKGDDELDKVELLQKIPGGGEHGPHAVLLAPDGKSLYVMAGNHTNLPKIDNFLTPKLWGEHFLLPRMWDAGGHAVGILAPGGWICQVDPDGKKWDLFCMGFRNQYDAAFNRDGELFTYDSDMEWDMNAPWYRPTRVCHCTLGSDFGWRSGTGVYPNYFPDNLPPVVDIGPGSPTGMTFGYGAKFPAKYQDALFMCDWSYGKLYALHLAPDGASYKGTFEEFLRGTPLPLTDIVINPADGAMYFAIGGRKTTSAVYRVTYVGKESTAASKGENLAGADARALRKKLEAYYGKQDQDSIEVAWQYLGHKDRFIRWAARTVLEHQDRKLWHEKAVAEKETQASLTALLGVIRTGKKNKDDQAYASKIQRKVLAALDRLDWKQLSHAQKLELLRLYGLTFVILGEPDAKTHAAMIERFDPLYPANDRELNAELCKLLVYLQAPSAAAKTMALLAKALTQEEQIEYALSLRNLKSGWELKEREGYFKWFLKASAYKGGYSFTKFVQNIKTEATMNLSAADKVALKDILNAKPEAVKPLPPRPFVKKWGTQEVVTLAEKGLKNRNFDKGRSMFAAANCFACHRFNQEGGSTGPDLTGVAARYSLSDLVEKITVPSKAISDQYQAVIVELNSGQIFQGRIVNLSEDNIMINTDLYDPNKLQSVDRKKIASILPSPISMMPTGLLDTLHDDEVLDLLAYLLSGGNRDHALFGKKE